LSKLSPFVDVLNATVRCNRNPSGEKVFWWWHAVVSIYVTPRDASLIAIPSHRCSGVLLRGPGIVNDFESVVPNEPSKLTPSASHANRLVLGVDKQLMIHGPGRGDITADLSIPLESESPPNWPNEIELGFSLGSGDPDFEPIRVNVFLRQDPSKLKETSAYWE
jgi:hypothetical protein